MKPTASHPTISTGRSRHNQGSIQTTWSGSGSRGVSSVSRNCCKVQVDKGSSNPTWMRKLEERYQRLHKKLASIPTSTSNTGRFNLLTKKFLNETLAKAALQNCASIDQNNDDNHQNNDNHHKDHHDQDKINDADHINDSSKGGTRPGSRQGKDNCEISNSIHRKDSLYTHSQLYSRRGSLYAETELVSQYASSRRPSEAQYPALSIEDQQVKGESNVESAKGEKNEELAAPTLHDNFLSRCSKCHRHLINNGTASTHLSQPLPGHNSPASTHPFAPPATHPSLLPDTVVGSGDTVDHSRNRRCTPVLERCVSERDEAARGNQSLDLAPPASLADVSSPAAPISSTTDRYHDTGLLQACSVDRLGSEVETVVCVCGAVRHGPGSTMVSERQPAAAAGRDNHQGLRGTRETDRNPGEMGDSFTPALRALNSISTVRNKRGSSTRAVQPNLNNHASSKSFPASTDRKNLPSSSKRRGGLEGGAGDEGLTQQQDLPGERSNMQFLPQMSVEAQHAISETLKEMGTIGDSKTEQEDIDDGEEDDVVEDFDNNNNDNDNSITSLPSFAEPLPTLPLQRRSWHPDTTTTQPQQQSRENSLTASHNTRQKSYRSTRNVDNRSTRNVDNKSSRNVDNSSVNTATRGGRSPRRSRTRPGSLYTSVTVRVDPKSERTLDTEVDIPSDGGEPGKMDLDLLSVASMGNAVTNRSTPDVRQEPVHRMHLPAITSRTEPNLIRSPRRDNNIRHVNYRIRGVGSYRVARENTFEITAPDFDVRYRDVITCQRGDRETPPPEIFEKSVGKVREWLSKHYSPSPYSPS